MFFTCKKFMCSDFTWEKDFCSRKWWGESPAQVFSCEFFEISKNTFFYRKPLVAAFEDRMSLMKITAFQSVIFLADILRHITRRKKNHNKFI